jgi:hypothetical protein
MVFVVWAGAGVIAFLIARSVPAGRPPGRVLEFATAVLITPLLGVLATMLDFGGWRSFDWRATLFCFLGAFAAVAASRLLRMSRL